MIGMKVCSIMVDRDGGRREPWDDTTQQDALVQQTADPGDIRGKRGGKSGRSSTQQLLSRDPHARTMCLYAGFPGVTSSKLRPYPGRSEQSLAVFRGKKGIQTKNGSVDERARDKKPLFSYSKAYLGSIHQENSR